MTVLIDPWGSTLIEDYQEIIDDFGLSAFNPSMLPNPNRIMRRLVVFAHRDLQKIADAIKQKKTLLCFIRNNANISKNSFW